MHLALVLVAAFFVSQQQVCLGASGVSQMLTPGGRAAGGHGLWNSPTPRPPSQLRSPISGLPRPGSVGKLLSRTPAQATPQHRRPVLTPTEMLLATDTIKDVDVEDHGSCSRASGEESESSRGVKRVMDSTSKSIMSASSHSRGRTGRTRDLEQEAMHLEMSELKSTLQEQVQDLAQFRGMMEGALKAKEAEVSRLRRKLDLASSRGKELEDRAQDASHEVERLNEALERQVNAMQEMAVNIKSADDATRHEMASIHVELAAARAALAAAESGRSEAESLLRAARQEMVSLGLHMKSVRERNDAQIKEAKLKNEAAARLQQTVEGLQGEVARLRALAARNQSEMEQLMEMERMRAENSKLLAERKLVDDERRRLHCEIQELKGNIRVVLRVRPLNADEKAAGQTLRFIGPTAPSGYGVELANPGGRDGAHRFVFDSLLEPDATQDAAFSEVSQLVTSILDGYRVCVFAYGQTGSGKTYTMEGPPGSGEESPERGMILRAVSTLFEEAAEREKRGWAHSIQVSFLEIYNEGLRDLLDNRYGFDKKMDIKTDPGTGMTHVSNLITMEVLDCNVGHCSHASSLCSHVPLIPISAIFSEELILCIPDTA